LIYNLPIDLEKTNCIICDSNNNHIYLKSRDIRYNTSENIFNLTKCNNCGLIYLNPRPTKNEILKFYPSDYRTRTTLSSEDLAKRKEKFKKKFLYYIFKNPWFIDKNIGKSILDLGCGSGELLIFFKDIGFEVSGIEIDPETSQFLKNTYNLNIHNQDMDSSFPFPDNSFDIVVARHSLEHTHNPLRVLLEIKRVLKQNGQLILGLPNIESFIAKLTVENWNDLDLPRHMYHFSPETISLLLTKAGFKINDIQYEFKISNKSLKNYFQKHGKNINLPNILLELLEFFFYIFRTSEWMIIKAKKNE